MVNPADSQIELLEEQLASVEQTLTSMRSLDRGEAERVAQRMDRLASQLLAVSEPRSMIDVHRDLGTKPAGDDEFSRLALEMQPPDGEG